MSMAEIWVIIIGSLVGVCCSLVGVFLVLRRLSMLGDAISHSVLFGIALAFLISATRSSLVMLVGAGLVGLLTAYMTDFLSRKGKLQQDASIGVSFTILFALGVILISAFAGQIDLDTNCVLYGEIAFAPLDVVELFGYEIGPRAFWVLALITFLNLLFVYLGFRSLKIISFDPVLAVTQGVSPNIWHYALMLMVSLTVVAAFESVGAILVVAMLVIPANAAYLVSRSVLGMLALAVFISLLSSVGGYYLASYFDASISAAMVMVAGGVFVTIVLLPDRLRC